MKLFINIINYNNLIIIIIIIIKGVLETKDHLLDPGRPGGGKSLGVMMKMMKKMMKLSWIIEYIYKFDK